jgi:hypothetical protein
MWKKNNWFLHHDNVPAHTSLVWQFLTSKNIRVIPHPPYVPDLAPCNFSLFPQDEITAQWALFWHDRGDPHRNTRGYQQTHIWELPGMHEIMGNMLGSLYTCPRGLLWRGQWKLGDMVRNFFYGKIPQNFSCPTYDICTLLGYYKQYSGNSFLMFQGNHWSHRQGQEIDNATKRLSWNVGKELRLHAV